MRRLHSMRDIVDAIIGDAPSPPRLCAKCGVRPQRKPKQRWCQECHREYVRNQRALRYRETDPDNCGPFSGVYFVQCGSFIKVGVSTNVYHRLRQIKSANPHPILPIGFIAEPRMAAANALEIEIHALFRPYRHRAEWFHDCAEVREYIASRAQPVPS